MSLVNKYIDSVSFLTATAVYDDVNLTVKSADGYYQSGGQYRQQVSGALLSSSVCSDCFTFDSLDYAASSSSDLCCLTQTPSQYYYPTGSTFANTTNIYTDVNLTNVAPDGFYSEPGGSQFRQISSSVLGSLQTCATCYTSRTLAFSSVSAVDVCCNLPSSSTYYVDYGTTLLTTSSIYSDTSGTIAADGFYKETSGNTYREMSSSVLAAQNPCSPCGGTNSWKAQDCNSGSVYYYLDQQDGYLNNNLIVLQYGYSVGDVVWVRQSPSGAVACATIISISSTPPNSKIDEGGNSGNGPYSNCSSCSIP
jgi:hypothetical protein